VVAICVVFVPVAAVGAVGVPVNAGDARSAFALNAVRSDALKYPSTEFVASGILKLGVAPPEETSGAVAVTLVTPAPPI
jgi:hypothetical protein